MAVKRTYTYEAMFLLSQAVAADFSGAITHIREVIARGHGTILAMKKWDERRLAYEIASQKRGVYILAYFTAPGPDIAHIERDCNLSEKILRAMILRCDHMTPEEIAGHDAQKELEIEAKMRAERPATAPVAAAPAAEPEQSEEPG
ncbi:MAG: 30S ribosomal protein S6 [Phycisphaerales bacterium]